MRTNPKLLAAILVSALVGTVLSGAIHELGHALAAASQGLKVTGIQPFWFLGRPHVSMSGPMTPRILATVDIAGVLSVVLVSLLGMFLIPFHLLDRKAAAVVAVIFPALFGQLVAWVFLPLFIFFGKQVKDDVAHFIAHSGIGPLWVSGAAFLLLSFCGIVFLVKTQFLANLREIKKGDYRIGRIPFQD